MNKKETPVEPTKNGSPDYRGLPKLRFSHEIQTSSVDVSINDARMLLGGLAPAPSGASRAMADYIRSQRRRLNPPPKSAQSRPLLNPNPHRIPPPIVLTANEPGDEDPK